jgi:ureidoacrylate peracid hydrolase
MAVELAGRTAVIVVDMINEFCKPGGAMVLPGYERLVGPQLQVIAGARQAGVPVIWVHDVHRANVRQDREWLKRSPHGVENTWAVEIIDDLGARADEIHVTVRRRMIWNSRADFVADGLGSSGSGYAA